MANIRDKEMAKTTPCICYIMEGQKDMCYSEGAVGVLSERQINELCEKGITKKRMPDNMANVIKKFKFSSETCKTYKGMGYDNYWNCVSEHMHMKT